MRTVGLRSRIADQLRTEVEDRFSDLSPAAVRVPEFLILGGVDASVGVQPGDLSSVVEIMAPSTRYSEFAQRVSSAFNVLGERSIPGGDAFALATPPYVVGSSSKTFTIILRRASTD
jgi:hypothetical protein